MPNRDYRLCSRVDILLWLLFEVSFAFIRTENVLLPRVLRLELGMFLVHFHSTNRIGGHCASSMLENLPPCETWLQKA